MGLRNEEIKFRVSKDEKDAIYSLCFRNQKLSESIRKVLLDRAVDFESSSKRKIAMYNSERSSIFEEISKLKLKIRALEVEDKLLLEKIEKEVDGTKIFSSGESLSYSAKKTKLHNVDVKYNTLEVPRGGEYFIQLSDSSKVWINSESKLKYPIQFAGDLRTVELSGEAYFEVITDSDRPFQVISDGQLVEVLGTKFNISSYKEDQLIYTTLLEGKVQVSSLENPEEPVIGIIQ